MPEKFYFYRREEPLRKFPTAGALLQHNERVSYQGYHRWGQCLVSNPELPSPSEWGWTKSESDAWHPRWTTLPETSKECLELVKCGCRAERGCKARYKCAKAGMSCTAFVNAMGNARERIKLNDFTS